MPDERYDSYKGVKFPKDFIDNVIIDEDGEDITAEVLKLIPRFGESNYEREQKERKKQAP